jgi:hypothetical protein
MRLPKQVWAAAGSCAVVLGGIGAAGPAISGPAAASARVYVYPDIVTFHGPEATAGQPTTAQCEASFHVACYSAKQIEAAYGVPALFAKGIDGKGETIVIVDSFGSPTIVKDLRKFDAGNHLPAPPRSRSTRRPRFARAGPERRPWTWSSPTPSPRTRRSCWSRPRWPRPRA